MTEADAELSDSIIVIQTTLVDIWQDFIRAYLTGEIPGADDSSPHTRDAASLNHDVSDGSNENWHFIAGAPEGGVYCRKSGKFVREIRHRRLKISKKPCSQADLPETHWLTTPCYTSNPRRLLGLFLDSGHATIFWPTRFNLEWLC